MKEKGFERIQPRIKRKRKDARGAGLWGLSRVRRDTILTRDEKVNQGRTGDALALRGDEGRDKLRKAAGRRKWP